MSGCGCGAAVCLRSVRVFVSRCSLPGGAVLGLGEVAATTCFLAGLAVRAGYVCPGCFLGGQQLPVQPYSAFPGVRADCFVSRFSRAFPGPVRMAGDTFWSWSRHLAAVVVAATRLDFIGMGERDVVYRFYLGADWLQPSRHAVGRLGAGGRGLFDELDARAERRWVGLAARPPR